MGSKNHIWIDPDQDPSRSGGAGWQWQWCTISRYRERWLRQAMGPLHHVDPIAWPCREAIRTSSHGPGSHPCDIASPQAYREDDVGAQVPDSRNADRDSGGTRRSASRTSFAQPLPPTTMPPETSAADLASKPLAPRIRLRTAAPRRNGRLCRQVQTGAR
jgi:hypothetical protein